MDSFQTITIPDPPSPRDPRTLVRWTHTRLRRCLLYGDWLRFLEDRLTTEIGNVRRTRWGHPDLSSNVFRSSVSQLAVLYDRPPTLRCAEGGQDLLDEVERAGWWQLAQRVQRDTIGLREMLVHVDVVDGEDGPELQFRPVPPDLVDRKSVV